MTLNQLLHRLMETGLFGLQLFAELAVLFVLISFLVGALHEWLPADKTRHYLSARHGRGYLIGALIGSATPFCSCSTVPLTLGLLKSGAGFGPTMTLLFTSPLVNPIIITLFWVTFGFEMTLLYTGMALSMAITISWLMDRAGFERYLRQDALVTKPTIATVSIDSLQPKAETPCCSSPKREPVAIAFDMTAGIGGTAVTAPALTVSQQRSIKAKRLFNEAVSQFRTFLPHIIIGVAIGAFAHGFVPDELLARYAGPDNLWAIPVSAIIGVPLYVRASTMIPIAMALTAKGMGVGAVIALVIGGAGASLPEVIMLKRMFQWPILSVFLLSVFGIAITTGYLAELIY
ncbi:MAG: permease [Sedimenticola sp.]